jgi:hypothetical protein
MRRFLYALGCVTMVALIAGVAGFGLLAYKGSELGAESRTFVDGAVPAIVPHWNKEELLDRATPEVRANANPEQLRAMSKRCPAWAGWFNTKERKARRWLLLSLAGRIPCRGLTLPGPSSRAGLPRSG